MDRETHRLAQLLRKQDRIKREAALLDAALAVALRDWSDSRPDFVSGGQASNAGARFLLTQAGVLKQKGRYHV